MVALKSTETSNT